jgi:hypothetical protein
MLVDLPLFLVISSRPLHLVTAPRPEKAPKNLEMSPTADLIPGAGAEDDVYWVCWEQTSCDAY